MEQSEVIKDVIKNIKNLAIKKKLTISVAESLTSGKIQSVLASVSGSSKFFVGGITTYNIDQKVNLLGVDRTRASKCDSVSQYVSNQMSVGCQEMFKSDLAIGITGYSEPYEEENIEIPYCFYSIAYKGVIIDHGKIESVTRCRNTNRKLFAKRVITKLYEQIKEI